MGHSVRPAFSRVSASEPDGYPPKKWTTPLAFRPTFLTTPIRQSRAHDRGGEGVMTAGKGGGQAGRRPHSIVEALNRDWDELVHRHRGSLPCWSRRHEALVEYESLDDMLAAAQGHPDAILGALLTEVSNGDQLAGRVVLQALMGRIVRMAGRDPSAGIDDYVAALWCQIQTYPLVSRPVRIAANLSMDTLKAVHAERRWLRQG